MKRFVPFYALLGSFLLCLFSAPLYAQTDETVDEIPELVFMNPVLVSGKANQEGAEYRFPNVAPGLDGNIKLKKFSRKEIYMQNVDYTDFGWNKAFQPQFGWPGNVPTNQDWYIDFELTFFKAGTTTKELVDKFTLTSLDVDGDGLSIKEYVIMEKASSVTYAPITYFSTTDNSIIVPPTCPVCGKQSMAISCKKCGGDGVDGRKKCKECNGVGKVYQECKHPWDGQDAVVQGPKDNFANIDTAATAVMATYVYNNKDVINFRIGAKSGDYVSNAGIRLNSLWFKGFNLNPLGYNVLPVKLHDFKAAKETKGVTLNWSAENEESLSHFVVERSVDGKTFKDLATVAASNASNNYSYKDITPITSTATVSYRIRMVDASQQISYSSVAAVRVSKETASNTIITTYPNPVQDQLKISVPAAWQGQTLQVTVYNNNGVPVGAKQYQSAGAMETVSISQLPKGMYIVKASTKSSTAQQTIYKN